MTQALADARAAGARRMLLGVFADNVRARAFYERQGFAVVAERRFKVGATWCDDRVYARDV
jgi:ribosomal protein S18 acetylase RimI-like enzyme